MRLRDFGTGLIAATVMFGLAWTPLFERIDTLSADILVMMRHMVYGQKHSPETSPAVVVAIDEQTYRTPPFAGTPKVMWTPALAPVLEAVLAGGAKVVGFDIVFPTSVEPFLPGFERPFLQFLRNSSRAGSIVLGKVQHQDNPVSPFPAQSMMVGHERNIRALNVVSDVDDVIRHVPLFFKVDNAGGHGRQTSMSLELALRALDTEPEEGADGKIELGGYTIPGSARNAMRVNFQGGDDIPTFSLADLHACAETGQTEYFTNHFKDKVVLLGTVLDVEDRRLTAKRFATGSGGGALVEPCVQQEETLSRGNVSRRDTIPGVYVHAAAINNLLRGDALVDIGRPAAAMLAGGAALLVVGVTLWLTPVAGFVTILTLGSAWTGTSLVAMQHGVMLPLFSILATIVFMYGFMLGHRYMVTDRQKHRIRRLFGLYLSPAVVSRMVDSDRLPELGGEMREVTVWFSDLANFTALSEGLSPGELVSLMNRYFSVVTDTIEAHGGFVDKYIGDAVVAVFGAPLDDPYHAGHAVAAALTMRARLEEMNASGELDGRRIVTRTGINTGQALVGNVGSSRRFNYTVMGDTVNLASRLEGANKAMGTPLLVSGETADQLPASIVLREVGMIRVKGRQAPVRVFEPLAMRSARNRRRQAQDLQPGKTVRETLPAPDHGHMNQAQQLAELFAEALTLYRGRRFTEAAELLADLADDPVAARLRGRAEAMALAPPPPDWDGIDTLLEK